MIDLPKQDAALYEALKGGKDVSIETLLVALGLETRADPRTDQQVVGVYVTRLNRRLRGHKQRVQPGQIKRTYRLTKTA